MPQSSPWDLFGASVRAVAGIALVPLPMGLRLAPHETVGQRRQDAGEDSADAHKKRQPMGRKPVMAFSAVIGGRLALEPWGQVLCGESGGGRDKRLPVKILGKETGRTPALLRPLNALQPPSAAGRGPTRRLDFPGKCATLCKGNEESRA